MTLAVDPLYGASMNLRDLPCTPIDLSLRKSERPARNGVESLFKVYEDYYRAGSHVLQSPDDFPKCARLCYAFLPGVEPGLFPLPCSLCFHMADIKPRITRATGFVVSSTLSGVGSGMPPVGRATVLCVTCLGRVPIFVCAPKVYTPTLQIKRDRQFPEGPQLLYLGTSGIYRATWDWSQWVVSTRILHHLQHPVTHQSRLQWIHPHTYFKL